MPFQTSLSPAQEQELRRLVETTALPFRDIAARLGISAATVSRQIRAHGWIRPQGAPPRGAARFAGRSDGRPRDHQAVVAESLWSVMARGAARLEAQATPPTPGQMRALSQLGTTLARVTRAGAPAPGRPAPTRGGRADPGPDRPFGAPLPWEDEDEPPARSLEELRLELARHLDRLAAEEEWERSFGFTDPDAPPEDAEGGSAMAEYFYRFQDGAGI